ncbi:hypothetical protein BY996DRAFT_6416064 [Phakopsora pachyrhizi]|nr:hypothetical protein BY996DRAFT_6416064 [Phakopsora pachyrhizi]
MAQKDLNTQWNAHTFGSCKLIANFGTGGSRIISLAEETNQRNSGSLGNKLSGPNIASHVTASKTQLWKHAVPHVLLKAGNNFTWTHGRLGLERRLSPKTSLGFHLCSIRPRIPAIVEAQYSDSNILLPSYTPTSAVVLAAPPIKASKTDKGNKQQFTVLLYACFDMSWMTRTIQDATEEPVNTHYRRLNALLDLTFHLLTAAPIAKSLSANPSDAAIQISNLESLAWDKEMVAEGCSGSVHELCPWSLQNVDGDFTAEIWRGINTLQDHNYKANNDEDSNNNENNEDDDNHDNHDNPCVHDALAYMFFIQQFYLEKRGE